MTKRASKVKKLQQSIESSSSTIMQDEDFQVFKVLLDKVKNKYNLSSTDFLNLTKDQIQIPSTIFTTRLSPLETEVKYLKENLSLDYKEIAELLGRNTKTIWQAYKNAIKKYPEQMEPSATGYKVPVSVLNDDLSILEATSMYLRDHFDLSYRKIGELLQRDERTIWTVCKRAIKKKHEAR